MSEICGLPENWVEIMKAEYPRRPGQGWPTAQKLVLRIIEEGRATWDQLVMSMRAYRQHCDKERITGTTFVRMARTQFGPDDWWLEFYELATSQRAEHLKTRARQLGYTQISDELLTDLDALEAKLTGIARQREEAQRQREIAGRKPTDAVVAQLAQLRRA